MALNCGWKRQLKTKEFPVNIRIATVAAASAALVAAGATAA